MKCHSNIRMICWFSIFCQYIRRTFTLNVNNLIAAGARVCVCMCRDCNWNGSFFLSHYNPFRIIFVCAYQKTRALSHTKLYIYFGWLLQTHSTLSEFHFDGWLGRLTHIYCSIGFAAGVSAMNNNTNNNKKNNLFCFYCQSQFVFPSNSNQNSRQVNQRARNRFRVFFVMSRRCRRTSDFLFFFFFLFLFLIRNWIRHNINAINNLILI